MIAELPLTSKERAAHYRAVGIWRDVTLAEQFFAVAGKDRDKTAIIVGDRRITYGELEGDIRGLAANLVALGLSPGDIVAGQLPNSAEMPLLHLACNLAGLLYMPLHDTWREGELSHLLDLAKVRLVVTPDVYRDFGHLTMFQTLQKDLPKLDFIYCLDGARSGAPAFADLLNRRPDQDALLAGRRPDPDMPAAIMLSGGTTALSKVSRFSSNDLLAMLSATADGSHYSNQDVSAAIAPAGTGATGYVYPILMPLLWGATSVILPRWGDPAEAVDLIIRHRCTCAVGIPTQLTKMVPVLETRSLEDFAAFRCFTDAGAPLPYETALKIETLMGCAVQSIYGSTDAGTPTAIRVDDPQEKRLTSVGRVVPHMLMELRDGEGRPVPQGDIGEICWTGPDKSWGYLGQDDQTKLMFGEDHFCHSGDLGQLDEDGYLRIVGRSKDMILRGGRNISPRAIEEPMMRHPAIVDIAVAPMPDPVLGERACAFVLLRDGASLTFPEMIAFLQGEKLAQWQMPERLEIVDEFPRGVGGKVLKADLTKLVTARMAAEAKATASS